MATMRERKDKLHDDKVNNELTDAINDYRKVAGVTDSKVMAIITAATLDAEQYQKALLEQQKAEAAKKPEPKTRTQHEIITGKDGRLYHLVPVTNTNDTVVTKPKTRKPTSQTKSPSKPQVHFEQAAPNNNDDVFVDVISVDDDAEEVSEDMSEEEGGQELLNSESE